MGDNKLHVLRCESHLNFCKHLKIALHLTTFSVFIPTAAHLAQTVERPPFKRMVVGSIPTVGANGRVAQMVEHESNKLRVQGSIPCVTILSPCGQMDKASVSGAEDCGFESHQGCLRDWSSGYDVCLTRRRSRVQSSGLVLLVLPWL